MSLPSYASGTSDAPLLGDTIGANLARSVETYPDREALVDCPSGRRWTYAELGRAVGDLARGLLAAGVAKGDRVGIWAPNCAEWVLVQYATATIGAIMVNINPAYRRHELEYVLNQSGVSLLVSSPGYRSSDYRGMVAEVRDACPALGAVVWLGESSWDDLIAGGASVPAERLVARAAELSCDDPINIQYTSGTTGSRRARRCRTTTSSTTATSWASWSGTPSGTGSACRCRSTTASAW
ncbi:Long-chain-fatty-acid--CoA ligase FadD15 [Micromonospora sp. MH33]|nr:AMP-binding protein [Micromonospora sp. MH33]PSK63715.1 Long-chain-fatty-acid--CoA ligase FadD15 [Micromonospora sp. MH33]